MSEITREEMIEKIIRITNNDEKEPTDPKLVRLNALFARRAFGDWNNKVRKMTEAITGLDICPAHDGFSEYMAVVATDNHGSHDYTKNEVCIIRHSDHALQRGHRGNHIDSFEAGTRKATDKEITAYVNSLTDEHYTMLCGI